MVRIFCTTCKRTTAHRRTFLGFFCTAGTCTGAGEHLFDVACPSRACEHAYAEAQVAAGL